MLEFGLSFFSFLSSSSFPYFLSLWFSFLFFHFIFAVPPIEIFPGGSGLSPSKEVNKGDIITRPAAQRRPGKGTRLVVLMCTNNSTSVVDMEIRSHVWRRRPRVLAM